MVHIIVKTDILRNPYIIFMFIRNAKFSVEQTLLMYPQIKKDVLVLCLIPFWYKESQFRLICTKLMKVKLFYETNWCHHF